MLDMQQRIDTNRIDILKKQFSLIVSYFNLGSIVPLQNINRGVLVYNIITSRN